MLQYLQDPLAGSKRDLDRVRQSSAVLRVDQESIHDHRYAVVLEPIELRWGGEILGLTVDQGTNEALLAGFLEELAELALPPPDEWGQQLDASPFAEPDDPIHDLRGGLSEYGA